MIEVLRRAREVSRANFLYFADPMIRVDNFIAWLETQGAPLSWQTWEIVAIQNAILTSPQPIGWQ